MSERMQCVGCENAEYGEDLYKYDGEILCRYCIVSKVCETSIPCEYFGECNDTTKKPKKCDCDEKDQRIAELESEKQTAVKEFAKELCYRLAYMENTIIGGKVYTQNKDFIERLNLLLKERGIE